MISNTALLSLIFGFGPPIVWLLLWLQEDKLHPEPKPAIIKTFLLGCGAVLLAIILEGLIEPLLTANKLFTLLSWAFIEELVKLGAVIFAMNYFLAPIDEPIDWLIYMITAALGFAALENTLFLIDPFNNTKLLDGLIVSNLRFVGATVLHLIASAAHGAALAICFYMNKKMKRKFYLLGFSTAVSVHFLFNYFLLSGSDSIVTTVLVFAGVWLLLLPLILIFEKVKHLRT